MNTTAIKEISFEELLLTREDVIPLLGGESEYAFLMHEYLDTLFEQGKQIFQIMGGYLVFDKLTFNPEKHLSKDHSVQQRVPEESQYYSQLRVKCSR